MIFVDTNIPMYLVGGDHPNKRSVIALLSDLAAAGEEFVTDAEVYQEILHRYRSLQRLEAVDDAFRALDNLVSDTFSFGREEVVEARELLDMVTGLSARDALHLAIMRRAGVGRILSFDRGFDAFPEVERVS